jgi:hypothetical protein
MEDRFRTKGIFRMGEDVRRSREDMFIATRIGSKCELRRFKRHPRLAYLHIFLRGFKDICPVPVVKPMPVNLTAPTPAPDPPVHTPVAPVIQTQPVQYTSPAPVPSPKPSVPWSPLACAVSSLQRDMAFAGLPPLDPRPSTGDASVAESSHPSYVETSQRRFHVGACIC